MKPAFEISPPAPRTVKAVVRYLGTNFAGWQIQPPPQRTVQGEIESALSKIMSRPTRATGASRTDSGVHAMGQVCSFPCPESVDLNTLRRSLSRMLAPDIRIERIEPAPQGFNARHNATAKRYGYTISLGRDADPFTAPFAWSISRMTNLDLLAKLCQRIEGEHDFEGYQSSGASEKKSTVRTIYSVKLHRGGIMTPIDAKDLWHIEFHGNGFLYKMIRNLTGTMISITRGTVAESALEERLTSPGPYHGHTAPAHGLTLIEVQY